MDGQHGHRRNNGHSCRFQPADGASAGIAAYELPPPSTASAIVDDHKSGSLILK